MRPTKKTFGPKKSKRFTPSACSRWSARDLALKDSTAAPTAWEGLCICISCDVTPWLRVSRILSKTSFTVMPWGFTTSIIQAGSSGIVIVIRETFGCSANSQILVGGQSGRSCTYARSSMMLNIIFGPRLKRGCKTIMEEWVAEGCWSKKQYMRSGQHINEKKKHVRGTGGWCKCALG